jgi:hypothetical protein
MMQILDLTNYNVAAIPADGDVTTTIADLAQFTELDDEDMERPGTVPHFAAFNALEDEYGAFEKKDGAFDFYDGAWMLFKDDSMITIIPIPA